MGDVSRRAVLGAAAWSVPALSLAVASPAAAASGGGEPQLWWDRSAVASGETATLLLQLPAPHEPFPDSAAVFVFPAGRVGDWNIRPVTSSWPPDAAHEYPYLAWRSNGLAQPGALAVFEIAFRRITDGSSAVFVPRFSAGGAAIEGPSMVAQ